MLKKIIITSTVSLMAMHTSFAEKPVNTQDQSTPQPAVISETPPRLLTDTTKPLIVDASEPEITIRLSANPSTGYQWFITGYDQELVKAKSYEYVSAEGQMVGASGVDVWQFKIDKDAFIAPHLFTLTFEYRRPFENHSEKTKVITVITISD